MKSKEDYKTIRSFLKEEKVKNSYFAEVGVVTTEKYSVAESYTFEIIGENLLVCTALLQRRASVTEIPKMTDFANRLNGHLVAVRTYVDPKNGEFRLDNHIYFPKDELSQADIRQCWDQLQWVVTAYSESFRFVYEDAWTAEEELEAMVELLATGYAQPEV